MKNKFIEIYNANIKREGADKLLEWLLSTDFFIAPASTKFHGSHASGLVEHSINVYERLCKSVADATDETKAIVSLLHDLCKNNYYKIEMRNSKNEITGQWEKVPYYTVENKLPYGHGEKSVYIISGFMRLTREESMAIRWHMGGFDDSVRGGCYDLGLAFEQYPLALHTHIADMQATYLDEKEVKI